MAESPFQQLAEHAALLLAVVFIFDVVALRWRIGQVSLRQAPVGLVLGAIGIAVILTPWQFTPGIVFDTCSVLLGISGLFFGAAPTAVAMALTAAFRLYQGGGGALTGVAVILATGTLGVAWRHYRRRPLAEISGRELYLFGLGIHLVMLALMFTLPWATALRVLASIALPVLVIYPLGVVALGALMVNRLRRERTSAALQESEAAYRRIVQTANEGIWAMDGSFRTTFVNQRMADLLGYTPEEMVGQPIDTFMLAEDLADHVARMAERQQGAPGVYERRFRGKDGLPRWLLVSATAHQDAAGRFAGAFAMFTDITERKQTEAALRVSEERFRRMAEQLVDVLYTTDHQGIITYISPSASSVFGWRPEKMIGRGFGEFLRQDEIARATQAFQTAVAGGQPTRNLGLAMLRKDGSAFAGELNGSPMVTDRGIVGTLGLIRDITERKQTEAALREGEQRMRAIVDNAPFGAHLYELGPEQRLVFVGANRAADSILGVDHQQFVGRTIEEAFPPLSQTDIPDAYRRVAATGERYDADQVDYADGSIRGAFEVHAFQTGPHRMATFFRDITERKRAEAALHQHLAELEAVHTVSAALRTAQTLDEALPILLDETLAALGAEAGTIWLYHPASGELRAAVDRGWFSQLDDTPMKPGEGIAGTVFASGQAHLSAEFARDPLAHPLQVGEIPAGWSGVCVPIRTAAETVGVLFVAVPLPHQITPEQVQLFGSLADMAGATLHRLRLLAQLQAQAQRVQQIVDTVPEGVLLLDAQGRVLLVNPLAERDLAALAQAQVGDVLARLGDRPLADLLAPPPAGLWHEVKAGTRTFAVIARPIGNAPAPESWVLVMDDVTELRDQQRYQQVQERLATVGQLAAGIAHDFNNIMGVIVLYAGLLEQAPELSTRHQRFVATIRQQADYAAKLIRQILDFSRRAPMARTALDLLSQTKELVKLLERTLPESIKLNVRYDRNEYIVQADPARLQQALMNLALNARDALPQGGRLTFTLSAFTLAPGQAAPLPDLGPGSWVRLDVTDTGMGIAAEHLPRMFEPFFTTKAPGQGTGLGLAQVYGIVKQHDGAIDVTSQVGAGTTFTLYLPLYAAPAAAPAPAPAADIPAGAETILLVEDNAATREAVGEALEALGYRVLPAATGREALAALAKPDHGVALVLSDVVMPEMGGVELYRRLRATHPAIKLLFMTGHALAEGGYAELVQAGAPWLQKPFAVADLAARVRVVLDATG